MNYLPFLSRFIITLLFLINTTILSAQTELTSSELQPPFDQLDPGAIFGYTRVALTDRVFVAIAADFSVQVMEGYKYDEESNTWNRIFRRTIDNNESQSIVTGLDSDVASDGSTLLSAKLIEFGENPCTLQNDCHRYAVIEVISEIDGQWAKTQYLSPFDLPQPIRSQLELPVSGSYEDSYFYDQSVKSKGFGRHLAILGNHLIVGSRLRNSECGAIVAYEKVGENWVFEELIKQEDISPGEPCAEFGFWFSFLENGHLHVPTDEKNYVLNPTEDGWQVAHIYAESDYQDVSKIHVADETVAMNVDSLGMVFYNRMPGGELEVADTIPDFYVNKFDGFDGAKAIGWSYSIELVAVDTTFVNFAVRQENGQWVVADTLQLINDPFDFGDLARINRVAMSDKRIYLGNFDTFFGADPLLLNIVEQGDDISLIPGDFGEMQEEPVLHVYPNPANQEIRIYPSDEAEIYYVFDVSGRLMTEGICTKRNTLIDVSGLTEGMYVITTIGSNGKRDSRLTIHR